MKNIDFQFFLARHSFIHTDKLRWPWLSHGNFTKYIHDQTWRPLTIINENTIFVRYFTKL